ncbi:MAG: hypothetical protein Q8N56_01395 [bacterium]|nr:hypothetical protein [bacterium]
MSSPSDFLKKIQAKPLGEKKVIFFLFASVLGAACLGFWLLLAKQQLSRINANQLRQELNIPGLEEQLKELQSLNASTEKLGEELKDLDELIKSGDLPAQ